MCVYIQQPNRATHPATNLATASRHTPEAEGKYTF